MLFFTFLAVNFAQEYKSVHQTEYEAHRSIEKKPPLKNNKNIEIIPFRKTSSLGLTRAVFGYLPDWEYSTAKNYLNYDLLTHIAAFDFTVSNTGAITNPSYWPWTDLINAAHSKGVKVIMCVVNFTASDIHTIITNATVKNTFFANVKSRLIQYSLDGVNIDFEGLNTADRGAAINTFMNELTTYIHQQVPGAEVSFAGPAVNWGGWDLPGLAASCDYIFIMGYDFYGSWSSSSGPSAPLTGGSYNITNTLKSTTSGYGNVVSSNPGKLILGVPYYGNKWKTKTSSAYSDTISYVSSMRYRNTAVDEVSYGRLWDAGSQTPWYRYQLSGVWHQVWYEDTVSLGLKYNLAESKNLKGVGMWALGYDGDKSELWELLRRKFKPVPVELTSFSANFANGFVSLSWSTATETNNHGFEIQKKPVGSAGDENWETVAFVKGHGTSTEPAAYYYKDKVAGHFTGRMLYRLKQTDYDGTFSFSSNVEVNTAGKGFELYQNYPNPFNPSTSIGYSLPVSGFVTLKVYDVLGSEAACLVNEYKQAGRYTVNFDASGLAGGVYFYSLISGKSHIVRKMTLQK